MPLPKVEWFKDAVPLSKLANPRYKVTAATGLTVRRVQPGDGGIFQCLARNTAGETQAYAQVFVSGEFDTLMTVKVTETCLFSFAHIIGMCLKCEKVPLPSVRPRVFQCLLPENRHYLPPGSQDPPGGGMSRFIPSMNSRCHGGFPPLECAQNPSKGRVLVS